jgi:hypothetical protein
MLTAAPQLRHPRSAVTTPLRGSPDVAASRIVDAAAVWLQYGRRWVSVLLRRVERMSVAIERTVVSRPMEARRRAKRVVGAATG